MSTKSSLCIFASTRDHKFLTSCCYCPWYYENAKHCYVDWNLTIWKIDYQLTVFIEMFVYTQKKMMNHLLSQGLFSQNNSQWKEDIKLFLKYEAAVLTLPEPSDVVWESGIDMVGLICHRERKDDAGLVVCIKWYPPAKYWQRVGRLGGPSVVAHSSQSMTSLLLCKVYRDVCCQWKWNVRGLEFGWNDWGMKKEAWLLGSCFPASPCCLLSRLSSKQNE